MKDCSDPSLCKAYPFTRQFLGLVSIAVNLSLAWGLFLLCLGEGSYQPVPTTQNLLWLIPFIFTFFLMFNLPLDWMAGYFLEKKAGRYKGSSSQWFLQWFSGGLTYVIVQTVGGYLFAAWIFGYVLVPIVVILVPGILAGARIWQFYLIPKHLRRQGTWPEGYEEALRDELKKLKEPWPEDLYLYHSEDGSTVNGGRVGMGNHSHLMISDSSAQKLTPRELALLITREERFLGWASAQKHFHYGLSWGLIGVLLAIPGIPLLELSGMTCWVWMLAALSTWHALSLLVLSGVARRQVLKADRKMVQETLSKREYSALLKKLQIQNGTPEHVVKVAELLFYSIPSLETRLHRLERL